MSDKFVLVKRGLDSNGNLIPVKDLQKHITDDSAHYSSIYYYNEGHKKQFDQLRSVAGIKDVKTDKLVFDFDDKSNPDNARLEAVELLNRFREQKVSRNAVEIYFSGNKGYHIILNLDKEITPDQAKELALNQFGKGLNTLDTVIYNPSRIFRISSTRHEESGLYKIPLDFTQISTLTTENIKLLAQNVGRDSNPSEIERYNVKVPTINTLPVNNQLNNTGKLKNNFDLARRPKGWKLSRWAIAQGYFEPGERNESMMILSATCKAMGYDQLGTYYMCKSALEKHMQRTGREEKFDKPELWGICERTFDGREIGQYSDDHPLIKKICDRLNIPVSDKSKITTVEDAFKEFTNYAKNIDNLTIKTGIEELDKKLRMTIGMSIGIVSPPGGGKTSLALQIVNSMSKNGHHSIVFSYDMYKDMVIQKLVQNHLNVSADEMFEKFKWDDKEFQQKAKEVIKREYENVAFCFESGQTIDDIIHTIEESKVKFNKDPKLLIVDYNELVITDVSDPTQSSALVAQKMRQIAKDYNLCVLSLYQPAKIGTDGPSKEIKSYYDAKGSGAIAQAVSVMLGVSRPGFDPAHPEDDKFLKLNCLKNRMGSIFSLDLHWDGQRGTVRSLTPSERVQLEHMIEEKNAEKDKKDGWQ